MSYPATAVMKREIKKRDFPDIEELLAIISDAGSEIIRLQNVCGYVPLTFKEFTQFIHQEM